MVLSKKIEIAEHLRAELARRNCLINSYGDTWVIFENLNYPGYFMYLQVGDWVAPHTGLIYKKVNCFEKKQLTYSKELGCGENIDLMINFAISPPFTDYVVGKVNIQRVYFDNVYTIYSSRIDRWHMLKGDLDIDQKKIMQNLKHVEMMQTEILWGIRKEDALHTILRFRDNDDYFDYDCDENAVMKGNIHE